MRSVAYQIHNLIRETTVFSNSIQLQRMRIYWRMARNQTYFQPCKAARGSTGMADRVGFCTTYQVIDATEQFRSVKILPHFLPTFIPGYDGAFSSSAIRSSAAVLPSAKSRLACSRANARTISRASFDGSPGFPSSSDRSLIGRVRFDHVEEPRELLGEFVQPFGSCG